jgi:hypothetical protein
LTKFKQILYVLAVLEALETVESEEKLGTTDNSTLSSDSG